MGRLYGRLGFDTPDIALNDGTTAGAAADAADQSLEYPVLKAAA